MTPMATPDPERTSAGQVAPVISGLPGSARFLFRSFKRILAGNTAALERMAQMDQALGGEYIFDQAFLDSAVRDLCDLCHRVAYHLNGMTGEDRLALYDAFQTIKDGLEDILAGGMGPLADRPVLPFVEIGWEMEPLVGLAGVGLAVLGHKMGLPAPEGLAVTVTGMRALGQGRDETVLPALHEALATLARTSGNAAAALELTLIATSGDAARGVLPGQALACAGAASPAEAEAVLRTFAEVFGTADPASSISPDPSALAVCITRKLPAMLRGSLQTLAHDPFLPPAMLAIAHPPDDPEGGDRYWLSRAAPHACLRCRIAPKTPKTAGTADATLLPGLPPASAPVTALTLGRDGLLRGSSWLLPAHTAHLAELGLAAERALGGPAVLHWALAPTGALQITSVEPITAPFPEWDPAWETEDTPPAASATVRLQGGQIACHGVAAGPVVLVDDDTAPEAVPLGAVGVAQAATPGLSRLVPRLAALLTEVGSAASHLATVAREHRTPALFGLAGAMALAQGALDGQNSQDSQNGQGAMVTVDAEQQRVYAGVQETLLRQAAMEHVQTVATPEFLTLRRLLRYIRPLNLVDPAAATFSPEHCQTLHDILHYAHETAVDRLLGVAPASRTFSTKARQKRDRTDSAADPAGQGDLDAPHRLDEDSPFALDIVDLGDGLAPHIHTADSVVRLEDVRSLPLRAFLEGLLRREVRRQEPGRLSLGDIMAGLGRTSRALQAPPQAVGRNLALAARDYANITLRLGYHFSVVDAVLSPRPEHTFLYFRYAGGFADDDRRIRRARFIQGILHRLRFKVSLQGDLVVGKRKLLEQAEAERLLRVLGALSAFTRQLDVELTSDVEADRQARVFLDACRETGIMDPAPSGDTA